MSDDRDLVEMKRMLKKLRRILEENGGGDSELAPLQKGGDNFWELKHRVLERVREIKELINERDSCRDKIQQIKAGNQIRKVMKTMSDEFNLMRQKYRKEASRARSKLTTEELQKRSDAIDALSSELKDLALINQGRTPGKGDSGDLGGDEYSQLQSQALFATSRRTSDDLAGQVGGGGGGGAAGGGASVTPVQEEQLTQAQMQQLKEIEENKAEINDVVLQIEKGVLDLKDMANMIGELGQEHNAMIDAIDGKVEDANEEMKDMNTRLKQALKESAQETKCIYIICCVILLAIVGIIVNTLI